MPAGLTQPLLDDANDPNSGSAHWQAIQADAQFKAANNPGTVIDPGTGGIIHNVGPNGERYPGVSPYVEGFERIPGGASGFAGDILQPSNPGTNAFVFSPQEQARQAAFEAGGTLPEGSPYAQYNTLPQIAQRAAPPVVPPQAGGLAPLAPAQGFGMMGDINLTSPDLMTRMRAIQQSIGQIGTGGMLGSPAQR